MTDAWLRQAGARVRFGWGEAGLRALGPGCAAVVIVDVLSFSTAVDVALGRGAVVLPYRWRDERAARFAREQGALLASHVRRFTDGLSLSPASLAALPAGTRLVLPSPNGGTLSAAAQDVTGAQVFTACLRNAGAVAAHVARLPGPLLVLAAGERWPDGMLRPALEDEWGAGAVIAALPGPHSPEAEAAAHAYRHVQDRLPDALGRCTSGLELAQRGFAADLALAARPGVSRAVPRLDGPAYRDASTPGP
ncbi:2-phosphosulfolactate phosphatase [Deinococcus aquiradiocola]|uniref:Probable 2-phosphosulfolactate phosphatase n=1 Tax=Deinococcus aquiradiocola TaxID=393059 RepID=A0A917PFK9_9DEIO|nr:2-phosphosulfolactate phosphatase [Deinococcus aquiradiocola]GGJ74916.1 hypothetical protein GCM10008939_19020 [Deinococcus aquiradiocola]